MSQNASFDPKVIEPGFLKRCFKMFVAYVILSPILFITSLFFSGISLVSLFFMARIGGDYMAPLCWIVGTLIGFWQIRFSSRLLMNKHTGQTETFLAVMYSSLLSCVAYLKRNKTYFLVWAVLYCVTVPIFLWAVAHLAQSDGSTVSTNSESLWFVSYSIIVISMSFMAYSLMAYQSPGNQYAVQSLAGEICVFVRNYEQKTYISAETLARVLFLKNDVKLNLSVNLLPLLLVFVLAPIGLFFIYLGVVDHRLMIEGFEIPGAKKAVQKQESFDTSQVVASGV